MPKYTTRFRIVWIDKQWLMQGLSIGAGDMLRRGILRVLRSIRAGRRYLHFKADQLEVACQVAANTGLGL